MTKQTTLTKQQMDAAKALAPEAVRQQALNRPLAQVGLSRVYGVMEGWEVAELAQANGVVEIKSIDTLNSALRQDDESALLVRAECCTLEKLKSLLETASYPRTVFLEVDVA